MGPLPRFRKSQSPLDRLVSRLRPPRESLHVRILREARRQGIGVVDRSAGAMLRLSLCVARRSATEPLPVAVATCLGRTATRATPRQLGRKKYRKSEILEELRRQQVDLTNASAGWMLRFMACVSVQVLTQRLPGAVAASVRKQVGRRLPEASFRGRLR